MRLSLLVSLLIHVVVLTALLFLFRVVPEVRLPSRVYSVRILSARKTAGGGEKGGKGDTKKEKKPSKVKKKVPAKPKKRKPKVKREKTEEKKMDVNVKEEKSTAIAIDAERFPFSYYLEAIEGRVSRNWFGSAVSGSKGLKCIIYFRLLRDGRIDELRVEKSSGNRYFDESALRAVRSSTPFPPLPRAFSGSYLGIHFAFVQSE